jgi:hypothetical protein
MLNGSKLYMEWHETDTLSDSTLFELSHMSTTDFRDAVGKAGLLQGAVAVEIAVGLLKRLNQLEDVCSAVCDDIETLEDELSTMKRIARRRALETP